MRLRLRSEWVPQSRFVHVQRGGTDPGVVVGGEVTLFNARNCEVGRAVLVDKWSGDLALVPASILEMEQDPLCRTYSGLILGLRLVAPKGAEVEPDCQVTALIMEVR